MKEQNLRHQLCGKWIISWYARRSETVSRVLFWPAACHKMLSSGTWVMESISYPTLAPLAIQFQELYLLGHFGESMTENDRSFTSLRPVNTCRKMISAGSRLPVDREDDWVVVGVDHVALSAMVRGKVTRRAFQSCAARSSTYLCNASHVEACSSVTVYLVRVLSKSYHCST